MAYQKQLDETIYRTELDISSPTNKGTKFKFIVAVMQYNGGTLKMDIKRLVYGAGNKGEYQPLGRISKSEMEDLLPVIKDCMERM